MHGVEEQNRFFIPCSALKNVNILGKEEDLIWLKRGISPPDPATKALVEWYKGPTLYGALNKAIHEVRFAVFAKHYSIPVSCLALTTWFFPNS